MRKLIAVFAMALATLSQAQLLDRVAVVVNESVILQSEIEQRATQVRQQTGQAITPQVEQQIIDQIVLEKLQLEQAARQGISVDQRTLERALTNFAQQQGLSLTALIERMGDDFALLREQVVNELTIQQLQRQIISREVTVGEREIDEFLASQAGLSATNVQYRLLYARFTEQSEANAVAEQLAQGATLADLVPEPRDLGWRAVEDLPSIFRDNVPGLRQGQATPVIESGDAWHLAVVSDIDDGSTVIEYQVRHLLVGTQGRNTEAARAIINDLAQRMQNGESMASLAQFSEDGGSAQNGGLLPWSAAEGWVPEFGEVISELEVGERSQPFESRFGWHIAQLEDTRVSTNGEEVKRAQVRQQLGEAKTQRALEQWLLDLRSQAFIEVK
ncbi:peptidylprolyl isomerase [Salinibius halmophilus]|uniref:peptidylprolyl isomerase n=1 Tax=Salinibius halmophilus TaxID=1853216 RepID=UPI000E662CC2|nr:peptidylprolyl isomerase [Salinibius halmophilus]